MSASTVVAAEAPTLELHPQQSLTLPLQAGQMLSLQVPAPITSAWIVLVEQQGIDSQIECSGQPAQSAPTGRVGIDVAIVEAAGLCRVSARMPRARPGAVRVSLHADDTGPLGADLAWWRRFADAQQAQEQQAGQDAGIALLEGFEDSHAEPLLVLSAVYGRGKLRMRRSHSQAALADLRLAAELAERHGLRDFLPPIHNGAGLTLLKTRDLAEADRAFQLAEAAARAIGAGYELASALNNRGLVDHHRGDLRSAARHYLPAIEAYRAAGELDHVAASLMNHADVAGKLGQVVEARDALQQAVAIRRDGPSRRSLAIALQNLGLLAARVGDWQQALAATLEAQKLLQALNQPADLIQIHLARSELFLALGQPERARHYANLARAQLAPEIAELHTPLVESMLARLHEDPRLAMQLHQSAADGHRHNRRHAYAAASRLDQAALAADLGQWEIVAAALASAALDLNRSGPILQARARLLEARLLFAAATTAAGDTASALAHVERAETAFQQLRSHQHVFDAALLRSRILLAGGRHDDAGAALQVALDAYRRLTASVPTPNLAVSLAAARKPWKDVALEWFAAAPRKPAAAAQLAALLEAWPLPQALASELPGELLQAYRYKVSALADGGLNEALRQELMGELEALESAIEATTPALVARRTNEPGQAIGASITTTPSAQRSRPTLRYLVGSHRSLLLLDDGQQVEAVDLPGRDELQQRLSDGLRNPWQMRQLADLLLPPAAMRLPQPWAIAADEALHDLPFAALWLAQTDGDGQPPFLLSGQDAGAELRVSLGVHSRLASLLPTVDAASAALAGVGQERAALAELLGERFIGVRINGDIGTAGGISTAGGIGAAAGSSALQPGPLRLPPAEILHVAGHGWIARERPMANTVADAPFGASDANGGVIEPILLAADAGLKLILLSACEGASGDAHGSGYSLAARYARHFRVPVIAPVEPVDDGDAAQFMRVLVSQLQQHDLLQAYAHSVRQTAGNSMRHYSPWQLVLP